MILFWRHWTSTTLEPLECLILPKMLKTSKFSLMFQPHMLILIESAVLKKKFMTLRVVKILKNLLLKFWSSIRNKWVRKKRKSLENTQTHTRSRSHWQNGLYESVLVTLKSRSLDLQSLSVPIRSPCSAGLRLFQRWVVLLTPPCWAWWTSYMQKTLSF